MSKERMSSMQYNCSIVIMLLLGILINTFQATYLKDFILHMSLFEFWISIIIGSIFAFSCLCAVSTIILFIGYCALSWTCGLCISVIVYNYSSFVISTALYGTIANLVIMLILSSIFPNIFSSLGSTLSFALIASVVTEISMSLFFHIHLAIMDYIVLIIVTLYIGYDLVKAQKYPKSFNSAIEAAADLYLDLINVFARLANIIGKKDNK